MFRSFEEFVPQSQSQIVIKGTPGFDVLSTSMPNSVLSAGAGADTYIFDRDEEVFVTIDDGSLLYPDPSVTGGGHDSLMLVGVDREHLSYQREGRDLVLAHIDDIADGQAKYGVRIHQFYNNDPSDPMYAGAPTGEMPYSAPPYPDDSVNRIEVLYLMEDGMHLVDLGIL